MSERKGSAYLGPMWAAVFVAGTAIRVHNAHRYPAYWGFDANFNWIYIERLLGGFALPEPTDHWAAAHPPLFYFAAAALVRAIGTRAPELAIMAIRFACVLPAIAAAWLAVRLVERTDPGAERRALVAAALVFFLPAHVVMSATLGEEVLASALASAALVLVCLGLAPSAAPGSGLVRAAGAGLSGGLAWLTKLSALLVLPSAVAGVLLQGFRRRTLRSAAARCAVLLLVAGISGGWFYARNLWRYGYLYPAQLAVHESMYSMPPGERHVLDYVRIPLATFTDPRVVNPDLLRSIWGSTYDTLWFDGHRHFVPNEGPWIGALGLLLLVLGLVPTAGFFVGAVRGGRRVVQGEGDVDVPLLVMLALTVAGYVAFTWRNPWFATVKGTYLLVAVVPFAFYASEGLEVLARGSRVRSAAVWLALALLVAAVMVVFTYGFVFMRQEMPGFPWQPRDGAP